jgi:predicted AAA+ superfamily ATPase
VLSKNTFTRPQAQELLRRLKAPRHLLQVVLGPRQVGKTTLALQVAQTSGLPYHYASADEPTLKEAPWLETQWTLARRLAQTGEALLVLDEVQKALGWSETLKRLWDEDTLQGLPLKVVLLASSPLLLQKGLSESLAGRFEVLHLPHWTFYEMEQAFGYTLPEYLYFGGYPGAAPLRGEPERFARYIKDALLETTLGRDILLHTRVEKPALLRRVLELGLLYSGQVLSYTKMLGQLQDAGNTVTLAHYLELLGGAGLLAALQKYAAEPFRRRASSPKLLALNTGLITAVLGLSPKEVWEDAALMGRLVETAVGAHLLAHAPHGGFEVYYWRERDLEVDFVLKKGRRLLALEVKSAPSQRTKGLKAFTQAFGGKGLLLGPGGIPLEAFLREDPLAFL